MLLMFRFTFHKFHMSECISEYIHKQKIRLTSHFHKTATFSQQLKSKQKQRIKGRFISFSTKPVAFCQVDSFQNVIAYFIVELHIPLVHRQCSSPINTRNLAQHSTIEFRNQLLECFAKQPPRITLSPAYTRLKDLHYIHCVTEISKNRCKQTITVSIAHIGTCKSTGIMLPFNHLQYANFSVF